MIIKELIINNKVFKFLSKNNFIYSSENSQGKTTLIRLLLFALGYPVPSTKGLEFSKLYVEVKIEVKGNLLTIIRQNDIVQVKNGKGNKDNDLIFKLPGEQADLLAIVNGIENPDLSESILGITYFDQDKGWTLLNRGIVIGKYRFSIEKLLSGLTKGNIENAQADLNIEKDKRKSYLRIKQIIQLNEERKKNIDDIDWSYIDNLQDQLRSIDLKLNQKKIQVKNLEVINRNNQKFIEFIEKMNIVIKLYGKKAILKAENIVDYDFNKNLVLAQISMKKNELRKISIEKNKLERNLNNKLQLFSDDDQIERFNQQIDKIKIPIDVIDSKLSSNYKEIKRLEKFINDSLKFTPQVSKIYSTLQKFAGLLGIENSIESTQNFIFTNNLKIYSGAKLHLLVLGLRLALLKVVQEQLDQTFPIIIDSPMSGEVDDKNIGKIFNLLNEEFSHNQIFIASIYNFKQKMSKKITLKNGILGDKI